MAWQSMSGALVLSNLCGSMYVLNRCYIFTNLQDKIIYDIETNMANHPVWFPHECSVKVGLFCSDVFLKVELVSSDLETVAPSLGYVHVIHDMSMYCVCIHGICCQSPPYPSAASWEQLAVMVRMAGLVTVYLREAIGGQAAS